MSLACILHCSSFPGGCRGADSAEGDCFVLFSNHTGAQGGEVQKGWTLLHRTCWFGLLPRTSWPWAPTPHPSLADGDLRLLQPFSHYTLASSLFLLNPAFSSLHSKLVSPAGSLLYSHAHPHTHWLGLNPHYTTKDKLHSLQLLPFPPT